MRAITVFPGQPHSARLDDIAEPAAADGAVLVRTLALGVCGTDRDIVAGDYGTAPPGQRTARPRPRIARPGEAAPKDCGLAAGDLVVGIVRRPDPVPCPACAVGEWDMCRNGRYTERGIKARDGYGAERFRIEPDFAVKVDACARPCSASCWSRRASSPRRGTRSNGSAGARARGSRRPCW